MRTPAPLPAKLAGTLTVGFVMALSVELFAPPLDCERVRQITRTLVERYPLPVTY